MAHYSVKIIGLVLAVVVGISCGGDVETSDSVFQCPEGYTCTPTGADAGAVDEGAPPDGTPTADAGTGVTEEPPASPDASQSPDSTTPPDEPGDTTCPALPDPPGDQIVDLAAEGLQEGDLIDDFLDEFLEAGNEVHIPAGTYAWNGDGFDGDLAGSSVVGDGEVFFDTGGGHTFDPSFRTSGAFEIRNITVKGKGGDDGKMRFYPNGPDANLVVRNFNQPDGSEDGRRVGMYVPRDAEGKVFFIDCHVEGFANNGLYANSPGYADGGGGAEVHVLRGLYRNNNITGVRIGSTNSTVIDTVVVNDEDAPRNQVSNGKINQRSIWVRAAGDDILIENVDITQSAQGSGPIVYKLDVPGGSGTIRNIRIRNDRSREAIDVPSDAGEWTGEDIHVTGDGDLSVEGGSFDNVCTGSDCDAPRITARKRCPED